MKDGMQKKIADTTALTALGNANQHQLMAVPSGINAGRLAALFMTAANDIKLVWSDSPAASWSIELSVAADSADLAFDCLMDAAGNIHVVYTEQATYDLVTRKLTFSGGSWSVGSKVVIYDGGLCYNPSVTIDSNLDLWVSWSRYLTPNYATRVKSSTDDGATWGSGPSDAGTELQTGFSSTLSLVIADQSYINVIYNNNDVALYIRSLPIGGGSWSAATAITSGGSVSARFDAAVGADGRLGVLYYDGQLYYREYNGVSWSSAESISPNPVTSPQLFYLENIPGVIYLQAFLGSQTRTWYTDRKTGVFSTPVALDPRGQPYDAVQLYDQSAASFQDLTAEASSWTEADIFHTGSSCLVKDAGDCFYLGMGVPFRYMQLLLSTAGAGGTVQYSYWNGAAWASFTPASGHSDLTSSPVALKLWTDYESIPSDWQRCAVNSLSYFWVRVTVLSSYSTGAIGSELTAVSEVLRLSLRR